MNKCPYCSADNLDEAVICQSCQRNLSDSVTPQTKKPARPLLPWILAGWLLLVLVAIPWQMNLINILLGGVLFVFSIVLLFKKSKSAKVNGGILLSLWLVCTLVGCVRLITPAASEIIFQLQATTDTPAASTTLSEDPTNTPWVVVITNTPTVVKTKRPTNTVKPTYSPDCRQMVSAESPAFDQLICEDFASVGDWNISYNDNGSFLVNPSVSGGKYKVSAETDPTKPGYMGGYYGWTYYPYKTHFNTSDYYISVTVDFPSGDYWTASGISFGDDNTIYHYMIDPYNCNYVLLKYDGTAEKWREVMGWKYSKLINKISENQISLLVKDQTVTLYINQQKARDITIEEQITSGWTGISYYVPYGKSGKFEFDNLLMMYPK